MCKDSLIKSCTISRDLMFRNACGVFEECMVFGLSHRLLCLLGAECILTGGILLGMLSDPDLYPASSSPATLSR